MILSIDPGNIESAYCLIEKETYKPIEFGKIKNEELINKIRNNEFDIVYGYEMVIEMIASYGMPVGKEVFDTCVWIGKFIEAHYSGNGSYIYRKDVKMNLCNSMRAKDSNVRQALIDRFGIVGTKKNQGWFYGFKKDIWSAYAVGITYLDKEN
jgi:hypothetical protein